MLRRRDYPVGPDLIRRALRRDGVFLMREILSRRGSVGASTVDSGP